MTRVSTEVREKDARLHYLLLSGGHGERVCLSRGCCCCRKDGGGHGERVRLSRGCCYRKDGNEQWTIEQPAVVTRVSTEARETRDCVTYCCLVDTEKECVFRGVVVVEKTEVINQSSMK